MAKIKNFIILRCDECKSENYIAAKKSKTKKDKPLVIKKFCFEKCRKHTIHQEKKKN